MGESRSGDKTMKDKDNKQDIIIDETSHRNKLVVLLEKLIAVVFTILMWCFLIWHIYSKLFSDVYADSSMEMLVLLLIVFVIILVVAGSWQFYNWYLYHGKDRRREFPPQPLDEVGELYGISSPNMERLQAIRQAAVIQFKDHKYYYCVEGEIKG